MKLYYGPASCSLAPHIALRESGLPFELQKVDLRGKEQTSPEFLAKNPKGYVPVLETDSKEFITEVAVILQYIADQKPGSGLAPEPKTLERYRLMEWLNFIATELHKSLGVLWRKDLSDDTKNYAIENVKKRLTYVNERLSSNAFIAGTTFTIADAYLYTILSWTAYLKFDVTPWPHVQKYMQKMVERPAVREALRAEGLLKEAA